LRSRLTHSRFVWIVPHIRQDDLESALRIESGARYSQRGRVPLFYSDDLRLPSGEVPVYFGIPQLKLEWNKQHPDRPLLNKDIRVRELSQTFRAMIQPGGKDESLRDLVFIPTDESVQVARKLRKEQQEAGGDIYRLGVCILTR